MKIIFIRHGESEANVQQIISNTGYIHGLTEKGNEQAVAVAQKLKSKYPNPTKIISSPLKRADETARILSEICSTEYMIDERLVEFHTGILEGKSDSHSWKQLYDLWKIWLSGESHSLALPGGESLIDVIARLEDFLNSVTSEQNEDDVIFCISHGGVLITALPNVPGMKNAEELKSYDLQNSDIVEIEFSQDEGFVCNMVGPIN